jgi:metallophosphoesterase superfamily enzyme
MAKPRKRNKRIYCTEEEFEVLKKIQKKIKVELSDNQNVLVIGDLHEPFCLEGYLEHCVETYHKYKCNKVVFIGDVIDNHYSSYHETDSNGMGGSDELDFAIQKIAKWYKAFPDADVTIGNHDRIIMRKAQTSSIPSKWIKQYKDVLETPNWNFTEEVIYNNVRYVHGDKSSKARTAAKRDMMSTVTGHFHTDLYVEWMFGKTRAIFAMGVGCGINSKSYAMGYMQGGKKEAVACGVVLNNGQTPITIPMPL